VWGTESDGCLNFMKNKLVHSWEDVFKILNSMTPEQRKANAAIFVKEGTEPVYPVLLDINMIGLCNEEMAEDYEFILEEGQPIAYAEEVTV